METLLLLSATDTSPLEDTASAAAPLFNDVCDGTLRSKETEVSKLRIYV